MNNNVQSTKVKSISNSTSNLKNEKGTKGGKFKNKMILPYMTIDEIDD